MKRSSKHSPIAIIVVLLAVAGALIGGATGATVMGAGGLALGFFLCGMVWASLGDSHKQFRVEVGPATDNGTRLQHQISVRIVDRDGWALHYKRIDLDDDDCDEQLAVAIAGMKYRLRTIEAAQQIASEL